MNTNSKIAALIARVEAKATALAGRPGVTAARAKLARIRAAADNHNRQLAGNPRIARPTRHAERRRAEIEQLATTATFVRGQYGEILYSARIPHDLRGHPSLRTLAAPAIALEHAMRAGILPEEFSDFDRKGRGSCLSVDVYGYGYGLLLVQVRRTSRRSANGYLKVAKEYVLTDGCESIEVPPARIKRAAKQDATIDSPIRALKPVLPAEWQARIDAPALKLAGAPGLAEAFKILEQRADGTLASVYDGSAWALGIQRKERARTDHDGGLYAYATAEQAIRAAKRGDVFNTAWLAGKALVLVRCQTGSGGRYVRYGEKLAFHALTPVEVLGPVVYAPVALAA